MLTRKLVGIAILLAACGGCVGAATEQQPVATDTAPVTIQATAAATPHASSPTTPLPPLSARNQIALAAIQTAEQAVNGTAIEIDSDYRRWEVDVLVDWTEHEIDISADGQTVLRQENSDADTDDFRRLSAVRRFMTEAIRTAVTRTPGDIAEVSLQTVEGTVAWDVTIETQPGQFAYVRVNAASGEVLD